MSKIVSAEFKSFVKQMLIKNKSERLGSVNHSEISNHSWMRLEFSHNRISLNISSVRQEKMDEDSDMFLQAWRTHSSSSKLNVNESKGNSICLDNE